MAAAVAAAAVTAAGGGSKKTSVWHHWVPIICIENNRFHQILRNRFAYFMNESCRITAQKSSKIHGNASVFLIQHHSIETFSLLIFREDEGQQKTFREPKHSPQYVMKKYLLRTYVLLPVSLDPLDEDVGQAFWRSAERENARHIC